MTGKFKIDTFCLNTYPLLHLGHFSLKTERKKFIILLDDFMLQN